MTTEQQYIASLDIEASYNLAKQMEAYRTNPVLGYRPAGSKAEFETGEDAEVLYGRFGTIQCPQG